MQIHYTKHHNTYVTNLNVAMEKLSEAQHKNDVSAIIGLQSAIKFNGLLHLPLDWLI
jgi:superoxide dismutase, Fe-Mn family